MAGPPKGFSNTGAEFIDQEVVKHRNLISSGSSEAFSKNVDWKAAEKRMNRDQFAVCK